MAYRQVTRQELEDYIAKNPGAAYRVNGQEQRSQFQDEDKGALMNLLTSISKPLRTIPGGLFAAITGKEQNNPFLTQSEEQSFAKDPGLFGAKSSIALGSSLIPIGAAKGVTGLKAVGQAAGKGAGAGVLGGYGYSEEGKELQGALTGGLTGGLIGGALQGVGEGVRALKQAKTAKMSDFGLETRGKAIGLDANKLASSKRTNITSATQGKEVIKNYFDDMDTLGLPTHSSEIASNSSDQALAIYGDEFNKLLKNADAKTVFTAKDTTKLISKIEEGFANNPKIAQNAQYQELVGDLIQLGDSYPPSALNAVREKARELINWSSSNNAAVSQRATSQVFDVIDDFFKNKVSGSGEVLSKMKNIYTVRPFFQAKAPGAGSIKVGTASTNIAVPSGAMQERIPEAIGRGIQQIPQGQGSSEIPQLLQKLISGGQRAIPAVAGISGGANMPMEQTPMDTTQMPQDNALNGLNLMLAQEVLNGNISASEANAVLQLLGMGGADESMTANQSKAQALQTSLDTLKNIWGGTGGGSKALETLGINIGSGTRALNQAKISVQEDLGRLQSQGVISPSERAEFERMMPNVWDDESLVQQKFQAIQDRINSY